MMKTRFGAIFGVTAEYPLTQLISVQGELVYSMRGWKNDSDFADVEVNQKIGYLEIPVLIRVNSPGGPPGPYLVLGPALAVKINDSFEVSKAGYSVDADAFEVKGTEFLFMLGGGLEFPGPSYTVFIEARGSGGFTPSYENVDIGGGVTREVDVSSETASLVVGVSF
jgi:hypothetical protein